MTKLTKSVPFTFIVAVLLATAIAPSGRASADGIEMSPCSDGWDNRIVGHGAFCFPVTCSDNSSCEAGGSCREVGRCWSRRMRPAGARQLDPGDEDSWVWIPSSGSECSGTCPGEAECRVARECGPAAAHASVPAEEQDSGCSAGQNGGFQPGFVLVALAWLWRRRRRSEQP